MHCITRTDVNEDSDTENEYLAKANYLCWLLEWSNICMHEDTVGTNRTMKPDENETAVWEARG